MATRYVNTDTGNNSWDGTSATFVSGTTGPKATLAGAEALITGVLTEPWTVYCVGETADTAAVTITGSTTDATNYIRIVGDNTSGKWDTGKYRLAVANADALIAQEDYIRLENLQIQKTSSSANVQACIYVIGQGASNEIRIANCIVWQAGNASYTEPGIYVNDADAIVKVWNTVVYGVGANASTNAAALVAAASVSVDVYNCTLIGSYVGLRRVGGTVTAANCYAYGSSAAYSGTISQTTCAANDTTAADAALDEIAHDTTASAGHAGFTNVTAGSEDYHLKSGSALIDVGTSDPGSGLFSDDIDGVARTGTWDIGADEYVSAAGLSIPVAMHHYRLRSSS